MTTPFTREDMLDRIATAITDSMGPDWNSRGGAEAVVENCGVFELYEALEEALSYANRRTMPWAERAAAALAKARGES